MSDSFCIRIYNVGNGNYVQGVYTAERVIRFCIDAGTLGKIENIDEKVPKTDVFFLTHWHEDHYSLFTLPGSSFSTIVYYLPETLTFSHDLSGRINNLYAKKAARHSSEHNLATLGNSYGHCPDEGSFIFFSKNRYSSCTSLNDVSVTYYIAQQPRGARNVTITSGAQKDSFLTEDSTGLDYVPLFVFPGDAKETNIGYLSNYCANKSLPVPLYLVSHHGSAANVCSTFHGSFPFDNNTRYFISGTRHAKGSASPYTVYTGSTIKERFFFMNDLTSWSFCEINLN